MNSILRTKWRSALLGLALTTALTGTQAQTWVSVNTDPSGDVSNPSILDGTGFSYAYDATSDSIWFKLDVDNLNASTAMDFGINVMVNIPNGGSTFNFWGSNNMAAYHKLVTVWVTGSPPSSYTGTIGVADNVGVGGSNYTNLSQNNISINANTAGQNIVLGMKRTDLITNAEMGGQSTVTMGIAAAVGASTSWNDDLYQAGTTIDINTSTVGLLEVRQNQVEWEVFPNPTSDLLTLKWEAQNGLRQQLEVRDVTGRLIQQADLGDASNGFQQHQLDLSALATGFYAVRLLANGQAVASSTVVRQ